MRKRIQMQYVGGETIESYRSKTNNYFVVNVIDMETGNLLCNQYVFLRSKIFTKYNLAVGDIIRMNVTVENNNGYLRFLYPKDIEIVKG